MEITDINQLDLNGTYSFADYLTWKFQETVELIRGKVVRMAAPIWQHQAVLGQLHIEMGLYFRNKNCKILMAPTDVRIPKNADDPNEKVFTVVQPDIFVLCDDKKQYNPLYGWVGIPDLVVEIVSPSTRKRDLTEKKGIYEEAGVAEYWVIFPQECMFFQFILENGKYKDYIVHANTDRFNSFLFPDLTIDLKIVFEDLKE